MSVATLGSLIIWLIVAIIVIAVVVYFVNWLYRRSTKEVSFVRTGLFGEKVVINGGAFVLSVHSRDHAGQHERAAHAGRAQPRRRAHHQGPHARRHRIAEFYVRVPPTREAVTIAAATLGRRTMNVAELDALLSGKFVSRAALGRLRNDHGGDA